MKIQLPKKVDWFMVKVFLAFAILATLAFVPSLTDFDSTQFDTTGNKVHIKAGASITNFNVDTISNFEEITIQTNVNITFTIRGKNSQFTNYVVLVPGTFVNSNLVASELVATDPILNQTNIPNAVGPLTNSAAGPPSFGLLANNLLQNSTVTINGTANQINGGGSVSLGGTLTLSTPQNINAGASPAFNAVNFTNWNGAMNTNNGGAAALVFGGPTSATAATLYETNITAATTLAAFDVSHTPNTASGIKLLVSCTGGTDRVLTFPNGCTGAGLGTPPAVTITNAKAAWFDIIFKPAGTIAAQTNVFWSPVF